MIQSHRTTASVEQSIGECIVIYKIHSHIALCSQHQGIDVSAPQNAETSDTYNKSIFEFWMIWRNVRSALRLRTARYAHENEMLGGFEVVRHSALLLAVSKTGKKRQGLQGPPLYAYLYETHSVEKVISGRRISTFVRLWTPFHLCEKLRYRGNLSAFVHARLDSTFVGPRPATQTCLLSVATVAGA